MYLCEMCHKRVRRNKHPTFHNIEQHPPVHHFCSTDCKYLWIEMVIETGKIPKAFIEEIGHGVRMRE